MSSLAPNLCFTWPDVEGHRLMAGRFITPKDYAWFLLASYPEITVVDIEVVEIATIVITINSGVRQDTMDRAREALNDRRPVNLLFALQRFSDVGGKV